MKPIISLAALLLHTLFGQAAPNVSSLIRFTPNQFTGVASIATDARGNVFICGVTQRPEELPRPMVRIGKPRAGGQDAFVTRLNRDGTVAITALIGGGGYDSADRVVVDSEGNVIISGMSSSIDFPIVGALHSVLGGQYVPFICKLDSSLRRVVFSTFVNGTYFSALAVDSADNILVAGTASASSTTPGLFPHQNSFWSDVFVLKLRPDGQMGYATRLHADYQSQASALAVDENGVACLVGHSLTGTFPLLNALQPFKPGGHGKQSGFLARIDASGELISSTFLGGGCNDQAKAVVINAAGEIYVAGVTSSDVIPIPAPAFAPTCGSLNHGFLIKLGPEATNVIYSKILSFGWHQTFSSLVVTPDDVAMVGGTISTLSAQSGVTFLARFTADGTSSTYFPQNECGAQTTIERIALKPSGKLVFSGYEIGSHLQDWTGSYVREIGLVEFRQKQAPSVQLIAPPPFHFGPEELLSLVAVTADFNDVESVTFYDGPTRLGVATNAPFSLALPPLRKGRHAFTAVARGHGKRVSSCPVTVTIGSPRNDDFANRIQLTGARRQMRGTTRGATVEEGEVLNGGYSVWYSWRAPRDGAYAFQVLDDSFRTYGTVLAGTELSQLTQLGGFFWSSRLTIACEAGQTYQIRMASYDYGATQFRLLIRAVERPPNDDFTAAQNISGSPVAVHGTLAHATRDDLGMRSDTAVWYSWTAPNSGLYLASAIGGYVTVFTGSTPSNLVSRGQQIYGLTNGWAFRAEADQSYFIAVAAAGGPEFTLTVASHEPPVNDDFASRLQIPAGAMSATGSCIGASTEIGERPIQYPEGHSVWWRWTAPSSAVYRADVFVPYPPPTVSRDGIPLLARPGWGEVVSVYSGSVLGALLSRTDPFLYRDAAWHAEAGMEYQIKVDGNAAMFVLDITPVPAPRNDRFADAITIHGNSSVRGSTIGATFEPGEPAHVIANPAIESSIWYRWTAPSTDLFVAETDTLMEIYSGDALTNLVRVLDSSTRQFRATAGTVYSIAVLNAPDFMLFLRPALRPPNDDFAQSQLLAGLSLDFVADLRDATTEPDEPDYSSWETPTATVWYSWIAPANGNFVLRATNAYWLGLAIYTGNALTNLNRVRYSTFHPEVDFEAVAGATYHFSLDHQPNNWMNQFSMELRHRSAPTNDAFANRILLEGNNVSIPASNIAATAEPGEPEHRYGSARQSVWFTWTAPLTGRASFEMSSTVSVFPALYTGAELTKLVSVLPPSVNGQRVNLSVAGGATYQIAVDGPGYAPRTGAFTLNIRYVDPPANDAFAARLPILNNEGNGTVEGASREPGERDYLTDPSGNSVWWAWTAPISGIYLIQIQAMESLEVTVFTGGALTSLQEVTPGHQSSSSHFYAQAGVDHALQIVGRGGIYAPYKVLLYYQTPPSNDDFENRIAFTDGINGTLAGATRQPGEPDVGSTNNGSVWYTWTAPEDGTFRFILDLPFLPLHIYRGNTLTNLERMDTGTSWSQPQVVATAGTSYVIRVSDYSSWSGATFVLLVAKGSNPSMPPPIRPPVLPPTPRLPAIATRVIETSTNLVNWQPWHTNAAQTNWTFSIGTEPQRFFRWAK